MEICSIALDPIEKKPLARFHPGSKILSVGGVGCTMHCPWCQNHDIAQPDDPTSVRTREVSPEELASEAQELTACGNIGVAYTYNEPLLHWRDVLACAQAVHARGLRNVLVTNGLIAPERLERILPFIDALNIDLKGFDQRAYDVTGGKLDTVKRNIELASERSHVEITTLIVPGLNDDMADIDAEAAWIAGIDPCTPLHLTRFFPRFLYADKAATPLDTMREAQTCASRHLKDVLLGNV